VKLNGEKFAYKNAFVSVSPVAKAPAEERNAQSGAG
jgi:hypothetical protein